MESKVRVLVVGAGGVGTIAALNLEVGGLATVTAVLRSNFAAVEQFGFQIKSSDHGRISGFKPSRIVNAIPNIAQDGLPAFDYIVCTTKNIPDVPPTVAELIAPAVTSGHSVIVLIQNGLNIEKPLFTAFPRNIVLSGISMIGVKEVAPGKVEQHDKDRLHIGAFHNTELDPDTEKLAAERFINIYNTGGKTDCKLVTDVGLSRWRKLIYNACLNPICAITRLDTGRIRLADDCVTTLVKPAMEEIKAAALAAGYSLPNGIAEEMVEVDPLDMYLQPSMLVDLKKGNLIEYENILGEPLREGIKRGVSMPITRTLYALCKAIQWKSREEKSLVTIPPEANYF